MSRYINAKQLKEQLEDFSKCCRDERKQGVDFVLDWVLPILEIADVQEVKHGKWVVWGMFDDLVKCSCCGFQDTINHVIYENLRYCGKCGAKMDGEHEQTT